VATFRCHTRFLHRSLQYFARFDLGASQSGAWHWLMRLSLSSFNKFSSLAQDGLSGALRISWKG